MYALTRLGEGLLVAHVMWALFFVTGTLLDARDERDIEGWPDALLRLTLFSAAGMALWGFAGFALGLLHLFTVAGLGIALVAEALVFVLIRREQPWAPEFWRRRWRLVKSAASIPAFIVYSAALLLSVPAVIPDFSYDGLRFHLAYAYDWFRAGRIYVDPYIRFPFYAYNTELLDAWMMVARAERFVTFLSWLSGMLASLGVCALVARLDTPAQAERSPLERGAAQAVYAILPFSLMLSAVFLRWWPTAMTDVPVSLMFLAVTAALAETALRFETALLRVALICGAFLAGMKPSYLLFVPVVVVGVFIAARRGRLNGRTTVLLLGSFLALGSTWYALNLIEDGDPVPPVFNLLLGRSDRYITAEDWTRITADYSPHRTLSQWLRFPIDEFFHTQSTQFREYGVTAVVFFLYGIIIMTPLLLARRARSPTQSAVATTFAFTASGLLYLVGVSALTRYTLLIYPCVAVCAGAFILDAAALVRRGMLFAPLVALLTVIPTPGSVEFYREFRAVYYIGLAQVMPDDETTLARFVPGYAQAEPFFHAPVSPADPGVLLIEAPLNYYVEMHGGRPLGDYVGAGRYADFVAAVDAGDARVYLDRRDIGAIVINRTVNILVPDELVYLRRQLEAGGWTELSSSDESFAVFVRASTRTPAPG